MIKLVYITTTIVLLSSCGSQQQSLLNQRSHSTNESIETPVDSVISEDTQDADAFAFVSACQENFAAAGLSLQLQDSDAGTEQLIMPLSCCQISDPSLMDKECLAFIK